MQRSDLERIVQRDRDDMDWWSVMLESGVAPSLADNPISKVFQGVNDTMPGYAPRQFHAASTGINSSLT